MYGWDQKRKKEISCTMTAMIPATQIVKYGIVFFSKKNACGKTPWLTHMAFIYIYIYIFFQKCEWQYCNLYGTFFSFSFLNIFFKKMQVSRLKLLDKITQWRGYSSWHTLTFFFNSIFLIKWKIASPKYFGRP